MRPLYAGGGRSSVDPVVFFKLQLLMFFEDIRSERRLMEVAADRLSLRWYLGYDLHEYVEYDSGEKELYDLSSDPYELKSQHETADPAFVANLQSKLNALRSCQGQSCRDAEDAP